MYSFVIENKSENDRSVTGTYMNIVKQACSLIDNTNTILKGEKPYNKLDYIISDTIQTSFRYFLYGYKNQIVWMQGVVPEESYMRRHSRLRFSVLSYMEKFVLKKSKLLLLVSDDMLKHYEKKYKLSLKDKSIIMPCLNETAIIEDAFSKDKYKENTFLYAGGMAKWQCFDKIAELYSKIEKADGNTMLYVYTFDIAIAEETIRKYGVKNYKIGCVPSDKLSEEIKGIKYGFVLREDCAVNNVATPTKFSNYLANGIIPIYSDSLHSFAAIDRKYGVGIVCNIDKTDNNVDEILRHMKEKVDSEELKLKCREIFNTYYNDNLYIDKIKCKILELNLKE